MRKFTMLLVASFATWSWLQAQTKVFKEVSEEISSQMRIITQDNNLVGYAVFTTLEKASADSFNYKITIMDENLNDLGTVNFREEGLTLQDISFEQDVLCFAYLKSNVIGKVYKWKNYKKEKDNARNFVYLQFIGLDGKIIKSEAIKATINTSLYVSGVQASGELKYPIQLNNIPSKGFACFYGDDNIASLQLYKPTGEKLWQKKVNVAGQFVNTRATENDVYLLSQQNRYTGFELLGFAVNDGASYEKVFLKDKQGNELRVLEFGTDPISRKLFLSGYINHPDKSERISTGTNWTKGPYLGLFTININGNKRADLIQQYSYWGDGSLEPSVSKRGRFEENGSYAMLYRSFKDNEGNTWFAGSALKKKTAWGAIGASVVTLPLIVPPLVLLGGGGTTRCKISDVVLIKQNAKGAISLENSIGSDESKYFPGKVPVGQYNGRSVYHLANSESKTHYLVVDDVKNILIYNINQKKVQRTIPHKDGGVKTNIYPAKEGYVMISTYNQKEHYTQFSIEAL